MKGEGAIVFIIVFVVFLAITFAYVELPPGNMISDAMGIDPTLVWNGFTVRTLLSAIFNGIIYGIIVWLIFTFARRTTKPKT
jgi:phage shock protein PspC (stress-responsive transcriptional regulator)